jgi:hypothetical protein
MKMEFMKHSPSPYSVKLHQDNRSGDYEMHLIQCTDERGQPHTVAEVNTYGVRSDELDGYAEGRANAKLLAAAPEMLEALKKIVTLYGCHPEQICGVAKAAIARAEEGFQ